MATLATLIDWISSAAGVRDVADAEARHAIDEEFQVRGLPNEDIYFWVRPIDNSRVMAQAAPRATRAAWKSIAVSLAVVGALFVLLLPFALNVNVGYRLSSLAQARDTLLNDQALLERAEAALVSPERLAELAAIQALVDPAPEELVPLPPAEEAWARRQQ